MTVQYNNIDVTGNEMMDNILSFYGQSVFNQDEGANNWTIENGETYTEFWKRVDGDLLAEGNQWAAYQVYEAFETKTDINVVIYTNATSDGGIGTFGSIML